MRDRKFPASPVTAFSRRNSNGTRDDEDDEDTSSGHSSHHQPIPSEIVNTTELIRPPSPTTPIPGIKHRPTITTRIDHLTSYLHLQHVHTKPPKDKAPHKINPLGAAFLLVHFGLLTLILYYELTVYGSPTTPPSKPFMDSQEFGVRLLFSNLGTLLASF